MSELKPQENIMFGDCMRISFDLDDTLILTGEGCKYEPPVKFPYSILYKERLRKGTVSLFKSLGCIKCEIYIYTTSERSEQYINRLFKLYGLRINKVINQQVHQNIVQGNRKEIMPSKVPSKFGIDLHIDDDITVKQNGTHFGFRVLIISKDDEDWALKVLNEVKRIKILKESI